MPHDHNHHGHDHHHNVSAKNIKAAFFLNLGFTIAEIIGGFYVNSVSIMSDALHDLGDSLSLGISWYLHNRSKKGADSKFTFGYSRFSLLGALINSIILIPDAPSTHPEQAPHQPLCHHGYHFQLSSSRPQSPTQTPSMPLVRCPRTRIPSAHRSHQ
ncbi:MAG: cation transporter, partial [Pedobacter sp.]